MSRFAEVEQFVRDHRGCGTLTPVTSSPSRGGYNLVLSCSCGQNLERWISAEETDAGPAPTAADFAPTPSAPPEFDISAVSTRDESLQDVMQAALDAIDGPKVASTTPTASGRPAIAASRPPTPPTPSAPPAPARPATPTVPATVRPAPPAQPAPSVPAPPPTPSSTAAQPPLAQPSMASTPPRPSAPTRPSPSPAAAAAPQSPPTAPKPARGARREPSEKPDRSSLEDALRATLAALGDAPLEAERLPAERVTTLDTLPPAGAAPLPGRKPDQQALQSALRATLDALEAEKKTPAHSRRGSLGVAGEHARRRRRLSIAGAVGIAFALAAAVGVGYGLNHLGQRPADVGAATPPRIVVRLKPSESERVSIEHAVQALRELQSVSRVDVPYRQYFSRVSFAKGDVDRHLEAISDTDLRAALSDTMALHVLAAAAWRAKTLNEKDKWEAVGEDPSVETCAAAKRLLAITDDAPNMSRAQWRGMTLAAGVPVLWDCAAERLSEVERGLRSKER